MAFLSKVGNILRQSATKRISSEVSPFKVSAFQAIRCMSNMPGSKVYVGGEFCAFSTYCLFQVSGFSVGSMFSFDRFLVTGISYQTDEQSLREAFAKYGQVVDGRLLDIILNYSSMWDIMGG